VSKARQLLIVEDDRHAREGYQTYLSDAGFHVRALEGGARVLEFAKSDKPDLVLLDLELPDLDGWEVARRLKSHELTRDIPIIAFSGRTLHHEQVSALRAGCDVYLTKPCAPDRLLRTIRKTLGLQDSASESVTDPSDPY
jgi:DNA-binding response OmpR family regulator